MGFIGKASSIDRETDFRSAVGAQEPRESTVVDGVTLAYTDSGGVGQQIDGASIDTNSPEPGFSWGLS